MIPFTKGHGLGNDYIVIDEADLPRPLDTRSSGSATATGAWAPTAYC